MKYSREKVDRINAEFDRIIDACYNKARLIVEANIELIKKIIPVLIEKKSIFKPECEKILNNFGGVKKIS